MKVKKENMLQIRLLDDNFARSYYDFKIEILLVFYVRRMKASLFIGILNIFQKSNQILNVL